MKFKILLIISVVIAAVLLIVQDRQSGRVDRDASPEVVHESAARGEDERLLSSSSEAFSMGILVVEGDLPVDSVAAYTPPPNNIFNQSEAILRNEPEKWFEEAKVLATPGLSEVEYTAALHQLLDQYAVIVKEGGYPTGFNHEITNALLGKNSKKIALLSQSHPRINAKGELVDQWGTPYFFHLESLSEVIVQSAGPDRIMHNDDDTRSAAN